MSNTLKSLALVALVVPMMSAHAGICNKSHPNWDAKTKSCPEKPVVLKKRTPATPPPKVVSEPSVPAAPLPQAVAALPEPPRSELVTTSRGTAVIPGRSHYVEGLTVATCRGFVAVPNVAWTTRPAVVESSSYELRAVPARTQP